MASYIGRRKFLATLGGAAAAWPLAARAQQRERMCRIGVLMHLAADDPEGQRRVAAFLQGLQEKHAPCRSFSCWSPIRSASVLPPACRARAATPPALPPTNSA